MDKLELGSRIRKIRENSKLKQREMGKLLKVSNVSVSDYETGRSYPTIDALVKIAEIGKVPVGWLIMGQDASLETLEKLLSTDDIRLLKAFHQAGDEDQKIILRIAELAAAAKDKGG